MPLYWWSRDSWHYTLTTQFKPNKDGDQNFLKVWNQRAIAGIKRVKSSAKTNAQSTDSRNATAENGKEISEKLSNIGKTSAQKSQTSADDIGPNKHKSERPQASSAQRNQDFVHRTQSGFTQFFKSIIFSPNRANHFTYRARGLPFCFVSASFAHVIDQWRRAMSLPLARAVGLQAWTFFCFGATLTTRSEEAHHKQASLRGFPPVFSFLSLYKQINEWQTRLYGNVMHSWGLFLCYFHSKLRFSWK